MPMKQKNGFLGPFFRVKISFCRCFQRVAPAHRPLLSATELRTYNARCHRYIERLGALTLGWIGWYEQTVREVLSTLAAHALALVTHNDYATRRELAIVDVLAIEIGRAHV